MGWEVNRGRVYFSSKEDAFGGLTGLTVARTRR